MVTKHTKAFSIAAVILAAAVLIYGFIDMQSYRAGYVSGYSAMSRVVDAACVKGDVLDAGLCARMEDDLYAYGGDGVYSATAIDTVTPFLVAQLATIATADQSAAATSAAAPARRTRRSRRSAQSAPAEAAPVAVQAVAPAAPVPPPEPPRPPTSGELAAQVTCPGKTEAGCKANALEPYCKWDVYDAYGGAASAARCRDTMFKISLGGDLTGMCAERAVKDRLPAAVRYDGVDPNTNQVVTVCIGNNGRFGYMTPQGDILGDIMSGSEMLRVPALRTKGQSLGATAVTVTASAAATTCAPPPAIPAPGCIPPANMQPPQNMPPPNGGHAMAPREIFFASVIEIVRALFYAPR